MSNIPRRKIYEKMLEFEDALIEMQILIYSEENFSKYLEKSKNLHEKLEEIFYEILALFVMFLENRKYPLGKEMQEDMISLAKKKGRIIDEISKNKKIPKKFIETCKQLDKIFKKHKIPKNLNEEREIFKVLDKFNDWIPEILTIRRDELN